jgi:osmotically-inducible protein OsmY
METNQVLQNEVEDAISHNSLLQGVAIEVTAIDGIITLAGHAGTYAKKVEAENTAAQVSGVKSVVANIEVLLSSLDQKNDEYITAGILNAFRWNWNTLNNTIKVQVENGWVTLTGTLEWNYQKEAATVAAGNLIGVKGVINNIVIAAATNIKVAKATIERALKSHVDIDITGIAVLVSGSDVTLKGSADSWYQKELAGRIAWKAPGVLNVYNELIVAPE